MSYTILIIMTIVTAFMAFGVSNMYRNRKQAIRQYHIAQDRLNGRLEDRAKELDFEVDDTYFTVNDMKEGILIGISKKRRQCIICTEQETFDFPFDSLVKCEVLKEEDETPQWYRRLGLSLTFEGDIARELIIGQHRRKENSYIGSMLMQNVESLQAYLNYATGKKKR